MNRNYKELICNRKLLMI